MTDDDTLDQPDEEDVELARDDRDKLVDDDDEPQPWAKLSSGDAD